MRIPCLRCFVAALAVVATTATVPGVIAAAHAQHSSPQRSKVVIQVSDGEQAKWNLALNNAKNIQTDLGAANVDIEIVVYGAGGIGMLKFDSPVGNRVGEAIASGVKILACETTMREDADGGARAGVPGSPRSKKIPVMICSPSRATRESMCSSGACCEHAGYECGTQTVGIPSTSAKQSLGKEPPRLGNTAGAVPVVAVIDATTQRTHGCSGSSRVALIGSIVPWRTSTTVKP